MDLVLHIVFGLIVLASGAMLGLALKDFVNKEEDVKTLLTKKHYQIPLSVAGGSIGLFGVFLPFVFTGSNAGGKVMIMSGSLLLGFALFTFVTSFVLHYYKLNVVKVWQKESKRATVLSGILSLVALFLLLDGLTYNAVLQFPLPKGIPFSNDPPLIAFYALFILSGAVLVLFVSDHEFFKKYGRHGILENVFYVAFPAGIVGARLWYVVGEWHKYKDNLGDIFAFRDGGLAIMGGALLGIIVGVWYMLAHRKEYSITFAVDVIVPTILIAQAIGRWGNFTNQEVYGGVINNINNWWFIPEFVKQQMFIDGAFRQPFFFIESTLNLIGYFLIRYGVGVGLKKYRKPLDLGFMYLVWYGLVRFMMEPLRDPNFNMGQGGNWSVYNALIFFVVGILLIVLNHLFKVYAYIDKWQGLTTLPSEDQSE